jgi:hypothetical protein
LVLVSYLLSSTSLNGIIVIKLVFGYKYPERGVVKMEKKAPDKLFLCLLNTRVGEKDWESIAEGVHAEHARYMADLWQRGIFWAGGPQADGKIAIEIYSVESVEEAARAQRNAPLYIKGYLYEDTYMEWHPRHWPPAYPDISPLTGKKSDP